MIRDCHKCEHGALGILCNGHVPCQKDPERRDIIDMQVHGCPIGIFKPGEGPRDLTACVHRGVQTRETECDSCAGRVMIKVFECSKHAECSLSEKPANVRFCGTCADRSAPTE